jgi:hypothetical protein
MTQVESQLQQKINNLKTAHQNKIADLTAESNKRVAKVKELSEKKFSALKDKLMTETNEKQVKATKRLQRQAEQDHIESAQTSKELKGKAKTVGEKAEKARAKAKDKKTKNAFISSIDEAVTANCIEKLKFYLEKNPNQKNERNSALQTPVMIVCEN